MEIVFIKNLKTIGSSELNVGRLYGRAKRRPVNRTAKQSSELNSVGPETPKSMIFFGSP